MPFASDVGTYGRLMLSGQGVHAQIWDQFEHMKDKLPGTFLVALVPGGGFPSSL